MPDFFDFTFCGEKMRLTNTGENVWRLQSEEPGGFDGHGAAQCIAADLGEDTAFEKYPFSVEEKAGEAFLRSKDGSYVHVSEKEILFYDGDGVLKRRVEKFGRKKDGVKARLSLFENERLYGTGERFDSVQRRGKRVHIYAIDKWCRTHGNSYIPIPFVMSSNVSAVFFNRYERSVLDIGSGGKNTFSAYQRYAPLDMYVFLCGAPEKIMTEYCRLTGFAPMPCDWAFGTLVCRYHPEFGTKDGILAMADNMEKNGFPWDAVIVEGWGTYNRSRWKELKEVSENIHSRGKKLMVYEQCGRFPENAEADFGLGDEYAVDSDSGTVLRQTRSMNFLDNFHNKKMRCIDLTDKKSIEKWQSIWDGLIYEVGVDGAKIDFCEQFPDKPSIRFSDGRKPFGAHHWYPTFFNSLGYRQFNKKESGGLVFARGGGIGSQRFPFVWAGDQIRQFFFLKAVIKASLSLGFSGVPFVSWDMAGYQPAWSLYDRRHEADVFIRAIEFTAFSVNIQTHGNVKRPYDFDERTRAVYRKYSLIHEALRPYIREQAEITVKTGLPMLRHLFFYDCADEKCLDTEDEYMLGGALLIAPVLDRGKKRDVYLPKGEWIDIFDGTEYSGGTTLKAFDVPLERIPVFRLKTHTSETLERALAEVTEICNSEQ